MEGARFPQRPFPDYPHWASARHLVGGRVFADLIFAPLFT